MAEILLQKLRVGTTCIGRMKPLVMHLLQKYIHPILGYTSMAKSYYQILQILVWVPGFFFLFLFLF